MTANVDAATTVNRLLAAVRDILDFYGAARDTPALGEHFKANCELIVSHLRGIETNLAAELRRLGGTEDDGVGQPQPSHSDQPHALPEGHDPILEEAEQREARLREEFETALAIPSLPALTVEVLREASSVVRTDCSLTHQMNRGAAYAVTPPGLV